MTTLARPALQSPRSEIDSASSATYDWHGVVGVRLIDWRRSDINEVEKQLGLERTRLDRPPDVTIRFVDRLPLMGELTYLASDAAYAGDAFVLTAGDDRRPVVRMPFASFGSSCEILAVRHVSRIPLLVPILNLTALQRGYLPVHASAFVHGGVGVLVTGGTRGGKTGTLLSFMSKGATFVGHDWVMLHQDGRAMYGLPLPMRMNGTYLSMLPEYRARLDLRTQRRVKMLSSLLRLGRWAFANASDTSLAARVRARLRASLAAGLTARVSPRQLFGAAAQLGAGAPDIVLFMRSRESEGVVAQPARPADLVRRLLPLLEFEWSEFDRYYKLFLAAFPNRRNELIEKRSRHLESGLLAALRGKPTYEVCYRSPVPMGELFRVVAPLMTSTGSSIDLGARGAVRV